jgi:hypothetical protein
MLLRNHQPHGARRRGVILIVVLSLLTLFAVLGLAFVLYADSSALSSNVAKQAENQTPPDMDPEQALALFLGQCIYDVMDDDTGVHSSLRGHSFSRNMYGWFYPAAANSQAAPWPINDKPFNGTGRLHTGTDATLWPYNNPYAIDDYFLVNYKFFQADGFLRDPERYVQGGYAAVRKNPAAPPGTYTGGFNPPYTYPDLNAFYLAAASANGTLLTPSFHREALFGQLDLATNPNWTSSAGKYLTVRPRPIDQLTQAQVSTNLGATFPYPIVWEQLTPVQQQQVTTLIATLQAQKTLLPYPSERNGDVKNLFWSTGGADSIWIDIDAPVMVAPDGRKYKMLVAPLILDLDGRINLNVVGNILAAGQTHGSNQGWGPWEVNPAKVLIAGTEYQNLFLGSPTAGAQRVLGRYGSTRTPASGVAPAGGIGAHSYAPADFDGLWNAGPNAGQVSGPGAFGPPSLGAGFALDPSYSSFAFFDPNVYANGFPNEYTVKHPLRYNALRPFSGIDAGTGQYASNRSFGALETAALLRSGGTGADALAGDLFRLLPNNLNTARTRQLITTVSADLDRPGITPYIPYVNDPISGAPVYSYNPARGYPIGPPLAVDMKNFRRPGLAQPAGSEFDANTWRSLAANLGRIDLNRLAFAQYRYPIPQANGTFLNTDLPKFYAAQQVRAQLAQDIFNALRQATGAPALVPPTAALLTQPDPGFQANRWLAQLAANIVDYIDDDDYSTPFVWNPVDPTVPDVNQDPRNFDPTLDPQKVGVNGRVVFGVEAPKLVINEVYSQYENNATDTFKNALGTQVGVTNNAAAYQVNFWVELLNPFLNDGVPPNNSFFTATGGGQALLQNSALGYSPYSIWITDHNAALDETTAAGVFNVLGQPDAPVRAVVTDLGAATDVDANGNAGQTVVLPVGQGYTGLPGPGSNKGFYLLGYNGAFNPVAAAAKGSDPKLTALLSHGTAQMSYTAPLGTALPTPTLLLRRLACPNLPPNPAPDPKNLGQYLPLNPNAPYNPYITVDRVDATQAATPPLVQDVREFIGTTSNDANIPALGARQSFGRVQPYQSNPLVAQTQTNAGQPRHTFGHHNYQSATAPLPATTSTATIKLPFDWFVHLDRQLISPAELLYVSAVKPSELTISFVQNVPVNNVPTPMPQQHLAHWAESDTRLARLFDLVEIHSRANGIVVGGRHPGKININTVWDVEVFRALCDAQRGNGFYGAGNDALVNAVFNQMRLQRTPNIGTNALSLQDRPFWSQGGLGFGPLQDALMRTGPRGVANNTPTLSLLSPLANNADYTSGVLTTRLLEPTAPGVAANPYQRLELLNKIYNNVTTRSNCFAVFLTVGFFEVTDDAARPVKLGAEIGAVEGRNIRHRMFAIVDRTQLNVLSLTITSLTDPGGKTLPSITPGVPFNLGAVSTFPDARTGRYWQIQQGTTMVLEPNTDNEETVTWTLNAANQLQAVAKNNHAIPVQVSIRGNPGPWTKYDPRQDAAVVPYFAVID